MGTIQHIRHSVDAIKKNRPVYNDILDFYSQVCQAQYRSREQVQLPPVELDKELLDIKTKNRLPLIDPSLFLIDHKNAAALLNELCDLAEEYAPGLASGAKKLKHALKNQDLDLESFFSGICNHHSSYLQKASLSLNIPERELYFFGYAAVRPSIQVGANQLKRYLADSDQTTTSHCPVCGNAPDMAFLDKDGRRHLKCCFCYHEWKVKRLGCVFCHCNSDEKQYYFYNQEEKEYRVNVCDQCHRYIKVVDLRQMDRRFYPSLELVSTLHLDMTAREKGYTNAGFKHDNISI